MNFDDFKFVHLSLDYLKEMHKVDPEVLYDNKPSYMNRPHLGILITHNDVKYVIPLTSAKKKHATWDDVTGTNYRIYEIINIEKVPVDKYDVLVDIEDNTVLLNMNISQTEWSKYKKRILSVLEIKKMVPIKDGICSLANLYLTSGLTKKEYDKRNLMNKEYQFCLKIKDEIEKKANKIYTKQMQTGKVLRFHCNYKQLEEAMKNYRVITDVELEVAPDITKEAEQELQENK